MINDLEGTTVTITFEDHRKLIAYFVYDIRSLFNQHYVCKLDYEYDFENHVGVTSKLDSFDHAFYCAKHLLKNELMYRHVILNYPFEFNDALNAIYEVISDKIIYRKVEIGIK